jgi:hypothetical protein
MNDGKKGLAAAVKALGFPRYSQRDLRAMRITHWVSQNTNAKLIANWQGHSDGGILIWNTYSDVISDANDAAEKEAILRLENC